MYSNFDISTAECITCTNQILKKLGAVQGVFGAEVNRINGQIIVSHTDEVTREQISETLCTLGIGEKHNEKMPDKRAK